jgi:hypothetical protein
MLRRVAPPRLLVVADGPRLDRPDDVAKCAAVREVLTQIDWPCDVMVDAAATNLGPKVRFETGMDWVFDQVEEAIIVEDDCLPHPSFFAYCTELLARYRTDECIWGISGNCFVQEHLATNDSYYFSRYPHIWGWATWRRAWRLHDPSMSAWPEVRTQGLLHAWLGDRRMVEYWHYLFETTYQRRHTWDYPWLLSCWQHGGLGITPTVNLVRNIGFGPDAAHTTQVDVRLAALRAEAMPLPLVHPQAVVRNVAADLWTEQVSFSGNLTNTLHALRRRLQRVKSRP